MFSHITRVRNSRFEQVWKQKQSTKGLFSIASLNFMFFNITKRWLQITREITLKWFHTAAIDALHTCSQNSISETKSPHPVEYREKKNANKHRNGLFIEKLLKNNVQFAIYIELISTYVFSVPVSFSSTHKLQTSML